MTKQTRAVTAKNYKLLYGLSAARCNICSQLLFELKQDEAGFIHIGEMGHQYAYSGGKKAPRAHTIDKESGDNSYNNLILLCANDHKRVDQNTDYYTIEKLKKIKSDFELFVSNQFVKPIQPDRRLIDMIRSDFPLQGLLYGLQDPLNSLPYDTGNIIDIKNFILEPNRPSYYPFFDEQLNYLMDNMQKYAWELSPYIVTYYSLSSSQDLRPTKEKPIPESLYDEIFMIVKNLYNSIYEWLDYCRINYA